MFPNMEPAAATIDCDGVLIFSTVFVMTLPETLKLLAEKEPSQKTNMTAVMPSDDQKANFFLVCSGLVFRLAIKDCTDIA